MTLTRRLFLAGVGGASAAAALAGCSDSGGNQAGVVTLGLTYVPNVQFAPFYLASANGYFAANGVNVALRHHGAQEDLFSALLTGTEQVVCASSDEAMIALAGGQDVRSFATMYRSYPVAVILPSELGVTTLPGLAGKRLGIPGRYGASYYALLAGLANAGMSEGDVELLEVGYTTVSALLTDKVDAVVGYQNNEPLQLAASGLPVSTVALVDPVTPNLVGPGLQALGEQVSDADLSAIAKAVQRAQAEIVADPNLGVAAASRICAGPRR